MRKWVITLGVLALTGGAADAQTLSAVLAQYQRGMPPGPVGVGLEASGTWSLPQGQMLESVRVTLYKQDGANWVTVFAQQVAAIQPQNRWVYNYPGTHTAGTYKVEVKMYRVGFGGTAVEVKVTEAQTVIP